uniref:Uncharacterized protein n=3 Tax=Timema TaxID=61471 RepID=A0A7R9ATM3_TIMSH|nr:unnamed protein product [Timema shepardi]CAD7399106.1 unnamed protein product [Timema poppensis]CAD7579279.1 unnamed protein product [Timema californicum]
MDLKRESNSPPDLPLPMQAGLVSSQTGLMAPPYPGVMYQTAQGMVYAAPTSALPNGVIFSLSQGGGTSTSSSGSSSHPQYITIPLPMALSAANGHAQEAADLSKNRK